MTKTMLGRLFDAGATSAAASRHDCDTERAMHTTTTADRRRLATLTISTTRALAAPARAVQIFRTFCISVDDMPSHAYACARSAPDPPRLSASEDARVRAKARKGRGRISQGRRGRAKSCQNAVQNAEFQTRSIPYPKLVRIPPVSHTDVPDVVAARTCSFVQFC